MAGNKYKEEPEEPQEQAGDEAAAAEVQARPAQESKPRKKKSRNFFQFISFLDVVDKNRIIHAMPFILFLTVIAMIYITNSFHAERTIREIDQTKKELKEKRAEFIATKSKLMQNSMQSEVAQHAAANNIDVKESTVPPKKIVLEKK